METTGKTNITVECTVNAPVEKAWQYWISPEHIMQWNYASDEWHCPSAINDLKKGGLFSYRMEARDGSFGFDFGGTYNEVKTNKLIDITLGDSRKLAIQFVPAGNQTNVIETFEAEEINSVELQQGGWQAILNNFKKYIETN